MDGRRRSTAAVPLTPEEQAREASVVAGAGAIHVHVRGSDGSPDAGQRLSLVKGWSVLPDFASVNVHEDGALELIGLLLDRGVGVEAGIWNARAEPAEGGGDAMANVEQIETALGSPVAPRLLHGLDASAWELVALAAARGYDTRTGLEDALRLPDGSIAANNAALVAAARRIIATSPRS